MLIIKSGDLLAATEDIICHQCNLQGVFGAGLAYQLKQKYNKCESETMKFVEDAKKLNQPVIEKFYLYQIKPTKYIANCFTQNEDFTTNYKAIEKVFKAIKKRAMNKLYPLSIACPYGMGTGIASGDWRTIEKILINIFDDYDITIYKLKEEE